LIDNGQTLTPKQCALYLILQQRFGPNPRKTDYNRARQRHKPPQQVREGRTGVPQGARRYVDKPTFYRRELEDAIQRVGEVFISLFRKPKVGIKILGLVFDAVIVYRWSKYYPNTQLLFSDSLPSVSRKVYLKTLPKRMGLSV